MSPSVFRPLLERAPARDGNERALDWEPDPLLGGRWDPPRVPARHEGLPEQAPSAAFEQFDLPVVVRSALRDDQGSEGSGVSEPEEAATQADDPADGSAGTRSFEPLTMEYLTGAPRIETVEAEFGDGLEFEPDELPEILPVETDEPPPDEALDGQVPTDPEDAAPGGASSEDIVDETTISTDGQTPGARVQMPGFDAADENSATRDGALSDGDTASDEDLFVGPPVPMIRESDHLAQIESVRLSVREAAWAEAHRKGLEEGATQTRMSLEAEVSRQREALASLVASIREAALDPIALHAPLRRLAVHLAMELVRGELSLSSDAIGRLIGTCLAGIDRSPGDHLVLALHPDDMERWVAQPAIALDRVELRTDPALSPGSVRLSAGDTVIEDLLEHRLSVIATRVLGEGAAQRLPRLGALLARGFAEGDISDVG